MEEAAKTCKTCKHFYRYYIQVGGGLYMPLDDGHCGNPRCRSRKADAPACHRHAAQPPKTKSK